MGAGVHLAAADAPGELYHGQASKSCILSLGMPSLTAWAGAPNGLFQFLAFIPLASRNTPLPAL